MTDEERLRGYVDVWWQAVNDFTDLLEGLAADDWGRETDLPGWDVRCIAAHTAHLEAVLAGAPEETVDIGERAHASLIAAYTEQGVVARAQAAPEDILDEIRESTTARHVALLADPPRDAAARPDILFGALDWSWGTLLRNRVLDIWMHEQDVRRAVDRPGNLHTAPAEHTSVYLAESLGFVVAKRVGAAPGTTVVLEVAGQPTTAVTVNAKGRGELLTEVPTSPDVTISTDRESFILLAGGRRTPAPGRVTLSGDTGLGQRVLDLMAVTP
ncbi:maleylpyruvate isomerase family mycothiol-dependent enzyme [Nocardioides sp. LHG3406-4]|uniref:maleylpyruvate isomerase family mycothiol-dependent enzyme n=1 Tax=Nocardioides sp. LHG3406-4 TaxID=2804575 RepID=UPI003CE9AB26